MFEQARHGLADELGLDRGCLAGERGGFLRQQQALALAMDGQLKAQPQQQRRWSAS